MYNYPVWHRIKVGSNFVLIHPWCYVTKLVGSHCFFPYEAMENIVKQWNIRPHCIMNAQISVTIIHKFNVLFLQQRIFGVLQQFPKNLVIAEKRQKFTESFDLLQWTVLAHCLGFLIHISIWLVPDKFQDPCSIAVLSAAIIHVYPHWNFSFVGFCDQ